MKLWLIIRQNYVINKVVWDGVTPWTYPAPHDLIIEDKDGNAGIGDWYEATEGIFYRPLSTPPDVPAELNVTP